MGKIMRSTKQLDPSAFHVQNISKNHAERVKKIQAKEETNTSSSWHTSVWSIATITVTTAKSMMDWIPSSFFPDNPAKGPILPFLKFSYWSTFFLQWVSPIALIMGWLNTIDSVKNFAKTKNQNYEAYLDLFVSGVTSIVSTILFFVGGAKIGILLTLGVLALNAAYGVLNCLKNIGYAALALSSDERKEYLMNAGKQLLAIVTNSLGYAVTFLLGIKTVGAALATVGNLYRQAVDHLAVLTFVSLTGIAADSAKHTLSTLANFFRNPKQTLSDLFISLRHDFRENKTRAIRSILLFPARILTLPVQLVLFGIFKVTENIMNYFKPIPTEGKALSIHDEAKVQSIHIEADNLYVPEFDQAKKSSEIIIARLKIDIQRYEGEYESIEKAPTSIQGKWILRHMLLDSNNWNNVNEVAEKISSQYQGTYTSFWKIKSNTEELVEQIDQHRYIK